MFLLQPCLIFASFVLFFQLLCQETGAELTTLPDDNMLQREYAGPVVFPNQFQVERKAQRSPSLRLRFGRRSAPDLLPSSVKRWFGDVNQKPIRSPSLRLRFGRRSDPNMPIHSNFDILMNPELQDNTLDELNNEPPPRFRFGRNDENDFDEKMNFLQANSFDEYNTSDDGRDFGEENDRDIVSVLMQAEKLRQMLRSLRRYDAGNAALDADDNQFKREERKPAPLRLRWGRSTGGKNYLMAEQKKAEKQNPINAEQEPNHESNKA